MASVHKSVLFLGTDSSLTHRYSYSLVLTKYLAHAAHIQSNEIWKVKQKFVPHVEPFKQ